MANPLRRYSRGLLAAQQGGLIPQYPEQGLLYNSVPAPAQAGTPQYAPPMSMGDYANELSYGLGKGVTNQLQGTYDMVAHPIDTARGLLDVASRPREWPAMAATAAGGLLKQATSSPAGFGQTVGELLSLKRPGVGAMRNDMTVYHGSPHNFDQFDIKKIGTGEGAQAYGHGLYVAENPEVAGQYRKTLSNDVFQIGDGSIFDPSSLQHLNVRNAARTGDLDKAIAKASQIAGSDSPVASVARADLETLQSIKGRGGITKASGSLYSVDLPDEHIANMLDWDKPLSEQPAAVRKAIDEVLDSGDLDPESVKAIRQYNSPGSVIYKAISDDTKQAGEAMGNYPGASEASKRLNALGIPGIRYLDGGSRGAGQGSRNYVVFDDKLLKILKKE